MFILVNVICHLNRAIIIPYISYGSVFMNIGLNEYIMNIYFIVVQYSTLKHALYNIFI